MMKRESVITTVCNNTLYGALQGNPFFGLWMKHLNGSATGHKNSFSLADHKMVFFSQTWSTLISLHEHTAYIHITLHIVNYPKLWPFYSNSNEYRLKNGKCLINFWTRLIWSSVHTILPLVLEGTGSTIEAQSCRYFSVHFISRKSQISCNVPCVFVITSMLGTSSTRPGKFFMTS